MCFNVFFRGMPVVRCIDDWIPFTYYNGLLSPTFANIGFEGG